LTETLAGDANHLGKTSLTGDFRMKTLHYASLLVNDEEVYGTAELVCGSGYLFRKDGERKATLVSYNDPNLLLFGLVALADAQAELDGDKVYVTSRTLQERAA
jgi:hypothetical protein